MKNGQEPISSHTMRPATAHSTAPENGSEPIFPGRREIGSEPIFPERSATAGDTDAASRAGATEPPIDASTPRTKKTSAIEHRHGERWRQPAEVAGAEIRAERGQAGARRDDAEHDAERRPGDTDDRAAEQGRGELLAHRQAHRVQKRDLAPAPGDHQHLRGVDEKRAGEQGDQRERRQVRAIGTRQAQRVVARLPRCQEPRPGRQDGGNRAARGRQGRCPARAAGRCDPRGRAARSAAAPPRCRACRSADERRRPAGGQPPAGLASRVRPGRGARRPSQAPVLRPPRGSARPSLRRASRSCAPRSRPAVRAAPAARGPGTGRCRAAAACGRDPADVRGHRRRDSRPRPSAASRASGKASHRDPARIPARTGPRSRTGCAPRAAPRRRRHD